MADETTQAPEVLVGIVMGSTSDWPTMKNAAEVADGTAGMSGREKWRERRKGKRKLGR